MTSTAIEKLYNRFVMPTYNRLGITIARGKGSFLWDTDGKKYLDLFPGWGTTALGYCHPAVTKAVRSQVGELVHVPNSFYNEPQALFAKALIESSFPGKVFFCNSGAETVESAIKLARRYGNGKRTEILSMTQSFHGRTMGALAATGQSKYSKVFEPMLPGFKHLPFNDLNAVKKAAGPKTAAVLIEVIQGEGGIHVASASYIRGLRKLCTQKKMLLIFDEVSTGMGRTGTLYAYQHYGVKPDILLLAKPAAGGLPIGMMIAAKPYADLLEKGTHATTFGGNPLVTAAGLATLNTVWKGPVLAQARKRSQQLFAGLKKLQKQHSIIKEIRGRGLMVGIELTMPGSAVIQEAARRGLLFNCTQEKVLRMYPALTISEKELAQGLRILDQSLAAAVRKTSK